MGRCTRMLMMALAIFFGLAGSASATTYYISSSSGSDSNSAAQAQNKSTPWAHLPGMANATGSVASFNPSPGDTFVLKGCDVWTNASFPVTWSWAGTSTSPITVGVDQTWYNTSNCSSGWNRPIFTACKTYSPTCTGAVIGTANSNNQFFAPTSNLNAYTTFDWLEVRDLYYNYDTTGFGGTEVFGCGYNDQNFTLDHWYVHHVEFGGNPTSTSAYLFLGSSSGTQCAGTVFENGVIDITDGTGCSAGGTSYPCYEWGSAFVYWQNVKNSVIKGTSGVVLDSATTAEVSGNDIGPIYSAYDAPTTHANCLETVNGATYYIHDNVIHDCGAGAESFEFGNPGETDYIWNNIWYNFYDNGLDFMQQGGTAKGLYLWNNIIAPPNSLTCIDGTKHGPGGYTTVDIENNQCITDIATGVDLTGLYSTVCASGITTSCTVQNNIAISPADAATQGYSQSGSIFYLPQTNNCNNQFASSCPINAGANLTSKWPSGYNTSDTMYGCMESAVSGVVESVCPAHVQVGRAGAGAGAWDIGPFQFGSGSVSGPAAPTSLTAVVQ
jgi:hypothetical protein